MLLVISFKDFQSHLTKLLPDECNVADEMDSLFCKDVVMLQCSIHGDTSVYIWLVLDQVSYRQRLCFISRSTSPQPLVLHNSRHRTEATWRAEVGRGGAGDWDVTHLPLFTFSPNYHGSTTSWRLSPALLFTNHQQFLSAFTNNVGIKKSHKLNSTTISVNINYH